MNLFGWKLKFVMVLTCSLVTAIFHLTSKFFLLSYLYRLDSVLDTLNFRVVLSGDFNIPNSDWKHRLSIIIIIILNRKETRSTLTRVYLGLVSLMADVGRNLLDLVFYNFNGIFLRTPSLAWWHLIIIIHPWS
jgi:hypothetical protein